MRRHSVPRHSTRPGGRHGGAETTRVSASPPRPCPTPHCGRLVRSGLCSRCRKRRDDLRGSASARGYTPEWAALSKRWLSHFPWCGQRLDGHRHAEHSRCTRDGRRVRADVTDHVVPLRSGGALLDPQNLQSLCTGCNVAKEKTKSDHAGLDGPAPARGRDGRGLQNRHAGLTFKPLWTPPVAPAKFSGGYPLGTTYPRRGRRQRAGLTPATRSRGPLDWDTPCDPDPGGVKR